MRARHPRTFGRGRWPLFLTIGGLFAVIVTLNYLAPTTSRGEGTAAQKTVAYDPPPGVVDYRKDPEKARRLVDQLARESHGDFSRLTDSQRQLLDSMTAGNGASMLRTTARALQAKEAPARK